MSGPERQLVITHEGRSDIEQVLMYSQEVWGLEQSDRYERSLYQCLRRIQTFPDYGRLLPALLADARSVLCKHHVIYYTYDDETVTIHRVLHERRHVARDMLTPPDNGER